ASYGSEGGIHFSLGLSGIPMAVTADQGIVFPNADELRVSRSVSNISLWMTSVNADPLSLSDLNRNYSGTGGISLSEDARRRRASAHGGTRSEKLLLEDHILVLNKDTGEVSTASQYREPVHAMPEFAFVAPPAVSQIDTPPGSAGPAERAQLDAY